MLELCKSKMGYYALGDAEKRTCAILLDRGLITKNGPGGAYRAVSPNYERCGGCGYVKHDKAACVRCDQTSFPFEEKARDAREFRDS